MPRPPAPPVPASEVNSLYPRYRLQALESTYIGYAIYYLVRNNVSIVTVEMQGSAPLHQGDDRRHHGDDRARLRTQQVLDGLGLRQKQFAAVHVDGPVAHCDLQFRVRRIVKLLRSFGVVDAERLCPRDGLAAVRAGDGPLVQRIGTRPDVQHSGTRRTTWVPGSSASLSLGS